MQRREKGTGGLTQRKDGLWMATYNCNERNKKVRKYLYGGTPEEAEYKLSIALSEQKKKRKETPRARDNKERQNFKKELSANGELLCAVCGWNGYGWEEMVEAHHIIPFKKGGQVTEENIIMLCPNHHGMVHKLSKFIDMGDSKESMILTVREYESRHKSRSEAGREASEILSRALNQAV